MATKTERRLIGHVLRPLATLLLVALTASPAAAWWDYGHRTVATIALAEVSPVTRAAVRRLLARATLLETPTCPARTIEDASVWADCIKPLGDRFSYAFSWHYQNVDVCQPFDLKRACADGNCVSAQVERTARMLGDRALPTRERVAALAVLVHFMGDLHQPLHAGDRADRGGNDVKANYGVIGGRTNFHMIWDGLLADRAISTPPAGPTGILAQVPPAERRALADGSLDDWSRDGWAVSRRAYADLTGGDGCGPKSAGRETLTAAAIDADIPLLRAQIAKSGLRLARLLDEALGHRAPHPSRVVRKR